MEQPCIKTEGVIKGEPFDEDAEEDVVTYDAVYFCQLQSAIKTEVSPLCWQNYSYHNLYVHIL